MTSKTPSATEFIGYYNAVFEEEVDAPILLSQARVPELFFDEMMNVYREAESFFEQHVPQPPVVGSAGPDSDRIFVCSPGDDRTLCVEVPDFSVITMQVLRKIQDRILSRHPLWRISLFGYSRDDTIMVYPSAIRFGSLPENDDSDINLQRFIEYAGKIRDKNERPRRDEIQYLTERLPKAIQDIGTKNFLVVGLRDRVQLEASRLVIYILVRGPVKEVISVVRPGDPDFVWTGTPRGIDSTGNILSENVVPDHAPFCLVTWLPPSDFRGELHIIEEASGKITPFVVTSEMIDQSHPVLK